MWTSKRGRDSEETITDPEDFPAKRSRRGAPRKPRVPRKLQHAAARGSSASAAEWAKVSRAADEALALLLKIDGKFQLCTRVRTPRTSVKLSSVELT